MKNCNSVFLCGYPKSGTTLLLSLLDCHPQLNVFPEELKIFRGVLQQKSLKDKVNFILSSTGAYVPSLGKVNFPSGKRDYSLINGTEYINSLKKKLKSAKTDKDLFLAIFDNWKEFSCNKGKDHLKYCVEKTPHNELYVDIIKKWFDNPKFIYIVRDPRDNYLSYKKKQPTLTLEQFILSWKMSVNSIKNLSDKELLVIKYEDLISDFNNNILRICSFLDIEYDDILTKPTRNGVIWEGNSMFGDNKGFVHKQAIGRYKHKLTKEEILKIEELLLKELKQFNYPIHYAKVRKKLPFNIEFSFYIKNMIRKYLERLKEIG